MRIGKNFPIVWALFASCAFHGSASASPVGEIKRPERIGTCFLICEGHLYSKAANVTEVQCKYNAVNIFPVLPRCLYSTSWVPSIFH